MEEIDNDLVQELGNLPKNKYFMGQDTFSQEVAYFLYGQNMDKYIDTFRKHEIALKNLWLLSDNDLKLLGVDSQEDRHKLLQSIRLDQTLQSYQQKQTTVNDDVVIAKNIAEQLEALNKSVDYLRRNMDRYELQDYYVGARSSGRSLAISVAQRARHLSTKLQSLIYTHPSTQGCLNRLLCKTDSKLPPKLDRRKRKLRKSVLIVSTAAIICISILVPYYY